MAKMHWQGKFGYGDVDREVDGSAEALGFEGFGVSHEAAAVERN